MLFYIVNVLNIKNARGYPRIITACYVQVIPTYTCIFIFR